MEKAQRNVLKQQLITFIKRVLRGNKDYPKDKTVLAINKSVKKIVNKTDQKKVRVATR